MQTSKEISTRSSSQSSLNSGKIEPNPLSLLFPFSLQPSAKPRPTAKKQLNLENQTHAKIFQHTMDPPKVAMTRREIPPQQTSSSQPVLRKEKETEKLPSSLDEFLANPNSLTLFNPAVFERTKKKPKTPTKSIKESPPRKFNDFDLPLQVKY